MLADVRGSPVISDAIISGLGYAIWYAAVARTAPQRQRQRQRLRN
jgi:hypothetical protein